MMGVDKVRTVIGIIGNVISFALYASPTPTFWRIWRNKSVEEFKPDPYISMVMFSTLWILYGLPIIHPDSILVVTISSIGLCMELIYLAIYFVYAPRKGRLQVVGGLLLELAFMGVVAMVTLMVFHTHESRANFVGIFFIIVGFLNYTSPLTIMRKVIRTKSVEFMPFYLSLANFLNGVIWLTYALIKFDLYMTIVTGMGTVSGTIQLILYACYYRSTPNGQEKGKPSEAELEKGNLTPLPAASVEAAAAPGMTA